MRRKTDPLRVDSVEEAPSLPTAADGSEPGGAVGERLQQLQVLTCVGRLAVTRQ